MSPAVVRRFLSGSSVVTVCTLVALWLLALMAGLSDFVPVIGFVVSSIPAIWLRERLPNETASRHAELERGE